MKKIIQDLVEKDEKLFSEIHYSVHQKYGHGQHLLMVGKSNVHVEIKEEYLEQFIAYYDGWIDSKI
jgi:hypothetical protein